MKRIVILMLSILALFTLVIASTTGTAGSVLTGFFEKILKVSPDVAIMIYTALLAIVGVILRVILKKIPGGPEGPIGKVIWGILAFFFGDGVRLEGSTDTAMLMEKLSEKFPNMTIVPKQPDAPGVVSSNMIVG
jgi:hypothetical protein